MQKVRKKIFHSTVEGEGEKIKLINMYISIKFGPFSKPFEST